MTIETEVFRIVSEEPLVVAMWYGMKIILIDSIKDKEKFSEFLYGQTLPLVEEHDNPVGWAYYCDYSKWLNLSYTKPKQMVTVVDVRDLPERYKGDIMWSGDTSMKEEPYVP